MAFNFADAKRSLNKAVMETFGLDATYKDCSLSSPVPIRARFHNKIDRFGDLDNSGYANIETSISTVVLSREQAKSLNVKRNGEIFFPDLNNLIVVLETRLDNTSPDEEAWQVTEK